MQELLNIEYFFFISILIKSKLQIFKEIGAHFFVWLESAWIGFLGGDFVSSRPTKVPQIASSEKNKIKLSLETQKKLKIKNSISLVINSHLRQWMV
jgi:hypothetical protein